MGQTQKQSFLVESLAMQPEVDGRLSNLTELKNDAAMEKKLSLEVRKIVEDYSEQDAAFKSALLELGRINTELCNVAEMSEQKNTKIDNLQKSVASEIAGNAAEEREKTIEGLKSTNLTSETTCESLQSSIMVTEQQLNQKEEEATNTLRMVERQHESFEAQLKQVQEERRAASDAVDEAAVRLRTTFVLAFICSLQLSS